MLVVERATLVAWSHLCVRVCECVRMCECVHVCMCVCVCVRERDKERECVRVCNVNGYTTHVTHRYMQTVKGATLVALVDE